MGTLYVVTIPASDPEDLTLRARRVLGEVALVASSCPEAQDLLTRHQVAAPHIVLPDPVQPATTDRILESLDSSDVAILCLDPSLCTSNSAQEVILAASEGGYPVAPVPGPTLPLTALVISGLPADSFVYLGELPRQPSARREILASVATEQRTVVILESPEGHAALLSELEDILGNRPLTIIPSNVSPVTAWHGSIAGAEDLLPDHAAGGQSVLVIGGARGGAKPWDVERLQAELQSYLDQGLGAKEASRQLTAESGWPRRDIYRLAVGKTLPTTSPTKGESIE